MGDRTWYYAQRKIACLVVYASESVNKQFEFRRVSKGERFRRESMVFVGVVVGALMTARRARLLDRMSLFWREFVSVVLYLQQSVVCV